MVRKLLALISVSLGLLCLPEDRVTAAPRQDVEFYMQRHIEQAAQKNPDKYQSMVERAGGNITGCLSCHKKAEDKKSHFRFLDPVTRPGKKDK
jgi:hypothetical protein